MSPSLSSRFNPGRFPGVFPGHLPVRPRRGLPSSVPVSIRAGLPAAATENTTENTTETATENITRLLARPFHSIRARIPFLPAILPAGLPSGGKPLPSVDLYRPISGRSDGRGFNPSRPFHRHVFRSCRHRSFQRREGSQEPGGRERFCTGTREIPPPGVCPASIFHRPTCALDDPSAQF